MAETYVVTITVNDEETIEELSFGFGGIGSKASNIATWVACRLTGTDITAWESVSDFVLDYKEGLVND